MNIFYCPNLSVGCHVALTETESHHAASVLRKKVGDTVFVFDGNGGLYEATITSVSKREVMLLPSAKVRTDPPVETSLHIAIALPKNMDRFEWFAEKATELGITEITPLICKNSERKEYKPERVEKIILSACKQSLQLYLPKLNPLTKFEKFVSESKIDFEKYIGYGRHSVSHLKQIYTGGKNAVVMIGPEGDFTEEEIKLSEKSGFRIVSLGKNRLRLETAGIFAACILNLANE